MDYQFFLELAIILVLTKLLGLGSKRLGIPQVVGMLFAGILLSPSIWQAMTGGSLIPIRADNKVLTILAEFGVVLIMFSAGLETDLKELKSNYLASGIVAAMGVIVPMALGIAISIPFFGTSNMRQCVFIGTILTATSVSITVETLREMGKLKGKVGMTILSAAIIDDVIGIVILSVVLSLEGGTAVIAEPVWYTVLKIVLFFLAAIIIGIAVKALFTYIQRKYPTHRRTSIFSLAFCLIYAYGAEHFFGIADITGAYMAGIILSITKESSYIDKKIDSSSYMIFSPIFFASIGMKVDFSTFSPSILLFALAFAAAGLLGKFVGCAGAAKLCKFNLNDSAKIGAGMLARGEVALIVAQKGISANILNANYLAPVIILVIISSLLAPILLKILYKKELPLVAPDNAALNS